MYVLGFCYYYLFGRPYDLFVGTVGMFGVSRGFRSPSDPPAGFFPPDVIWKCVTTLLTDS